MRPTVAMLFALAFLVQFLVGGLSGIWVASPALDAHANNSYVVVAHFHYTLLAGSIFGFFAGVYHWWPKVTGRLLGERLGRVHLVLFVLGTNLTFAPQFVLGEDGMTRRIADYPADAGWSALNLLSTVGAFFVACRCSCSWSTPLVVARGARRRRSMGRRTRSSGRPPRRRRAGTSPRAADRPFLRPAAGPRRGAVDDHRASGARCSRCGRCSSCCSRRGDHARRCSARAAVAVARARAAGRAPSAGTGAGAELSPATPLLALGVAALISGAELGTGACCSAR